MVSKRRRVLGFGHGKLLASRAEEETDRKGVGGRLKPALLEE